MKKILRLKSVLSSIVLTVVSSFGLCANGDQKNKNVINHTASVVTQVVSGGVVCLGGSALYLGLKSKPEDFRNGYKPVLGLIPMVVGLIPATYGTLSLLSKDKSKDIVASAINIGSGAIAAIGSGCWMFRNLVEYYDCMVTGIVFPNIPLAATFLGGIVLLTNGIEAVIAK
ncbi:MAG: hypothetical protein RsTaC01_0945 [Candidatus Paraimprobicoccus trichonymphae]|uniref:Uncharacterized protein n=1 Tax=Candidatus Paraimprobicoccus trichonymphae TaxID=3033793 RepID=A0AA48I089_9FIRM|nr:MAG: hypothetical protein RsTaC01_0945 [Candidatus Paraimprobicoccus trichonymphae]